MKYTGLILFVMIALFSCRPHIQETDTISERGPDSLYAAYLVMARSLPDSLGRLAPYVATDRDSGTTYQVLDSPYLAIGRLIDTTHTFAVSCINGKNDTAILKVYRNDNEWNLVGLYVVPFEVQYISYVNADNDPGFYEIMLSSTGNVNGNRQHNLYIYDPERAILSYAGEFFCGDDDIGADAGESGYKVIAENNTIIVDYEGSNVGVSRSLYLWRGDSLVLLRECYIENDMNARVLSYSVNRDTCFSCGLAEVFSEKTNQQSARYKKYWDHFFDLK